LAIFVAERLVFYSKEPDFGTCPVTQ